MKLFLTLLIVALDMPLSSAETIRAKGGEFHKQYEFQRRLPKGGKGGQGEAMALPKKTLASANLLAESTSALSRMHTPNAV
jgi:hypothetical protein